MATPLQILQTQFGFSAFRLEQEVIINSVLSKRDTFALMPTGGGKSLCYQIPALVLDGLTIVISPLIALMKDQVDALRLNGVEAAYLNSTQSFQEQDAILLKARNKTLKLLYLAPEKLLRQDSSFFSTLIAFNISLIAIDEAHCISHWGHDFRPEYLLLAQLKRALPGVPVIALTATADSLTRKDIIEKLELKDPATFVSSFNRANIRYTVEPKKNSVDKLLSYLEKRKEESGIIYCLSRSSTESLAIMLTEEGFPALPYHAGIEKEVRARNQEQFIRDEVKIMVATIAFGMGIDKSNVRYVVHMDLPKSIESYYQETGRAGRDGLESEALFYYSHADVSKMKNFVKNDANATQTDIALKKLDEMARYGELSTCRRKYLLNYFDEATGDYCGNCDTCLTKEELVDQTIAAQKALSAVTRLQERFGAGYVIDFLRGSDSIKIQEHHKQLKTFGIGATTGKDEWNHIIRELVAGNYLSKTDGAYPLLKLTEKSNAVLRGEQPVMLQKVKEITAGQDVAPEYDIVLFQELKNVRRALAAEENVPAYIVLSDATLLEMAAYMPQTTEELGRISGFGNVKLERYGPPFLEAVIRYAEKHQLGSRMHNRAPRRQKREKLERDIDTKKQTLQYFKEGKSLREIAELRSLSPSTIEGHIVFYVQQGEIAPEDLMDKQRITTITKAITEANTKALTPIRELLGEEYSYGEIKFVMAYLNYA